MFMSEHNRMRSGYLPVSGGHQIYYEIHGKANGRPAVFLHGGPGGGMDRLVLKSYDLSAWCVVLFDQRGCGKSTPFGSLVQNTTWHLVDDIEALRCHIGVDSWFVSGGSWGTTLALAYAEMYPSRVSGMLLRGVCFCDDASFRWLYQAGGASEIYPDRWKGFLSVLPELLHTASWKSIMRYYQQKLKGDDAQRYANAWWKWEQSVSYFRPRSDDSSPKEALALALLENHYFVNGCWLKKDQLYKGLYKLRHIPITIIHGRYDLVCPISASFAIKDVLPHVKLHITPDGGHAFREPGTFRRSKQTMRAMRHMWTRKKTRE
jgi:proline iminopeptidase